MYARLSTAFAVALFVATPSHATQARDLLEAMEVRQIIEVMRDEGLKYGDEIARDLMPGPTPAWRDTVSRIYNVETMEDVVVAGFEEALGDADVTPLIEFFRSEDGKQLVGMEISAREALIDEAVEEGARAAYRQAKIDNDDRLELLEDFVEANDLIDANVVGALNSNFMFYRGLVDGGAFEMSESDMLADVWGQEEETRSNTTEWIYAFLLMAYGPVDQDIVRQYVDLSKTDAGQAMNRALFAGFDDMYGDISYALGLASATQMQGQDL